MSDSAQYHATEDAHTGPIKNPKQLLLAVFFSFIVPILIIVGLVSYVVSGLKPSGSAQGDNMSLYGVSQEARDREVADRIVFMADGEIIEDATPEQFFTATRSPRAKAFLSEVR